MASRHFQSFAQRHCTPVLIGWVLFVVMLLAMIPGTSQAGETGESIHSGALSVNEALAGVSLTRAWKFRLGDDPSGADPELDDSAWQTVTLPHRWHSDDGGASSQNYAWYRLHLKFSVRDELQREQLAQLGFRLGGVLSAYEVYAGGEQVGGVGKLAPAPDPVIDYNRMAIVPIPLSAISPEGELVIALRVWAGEGVVFEAFGGGPWGSKFELGRFANLLMSLVLTQMPGLLSSVFCILFGFYHLYLYSRNRQLASFLWFGLIAIDIGLYGLALNQWRYCLGWEFVVFKKLEYGTLYLIPALSLQLIWSRLDEPIGRWLRLYQVLFVLVAMILMALPGVDAHIATLSAWQVFTLPALGLVTWLLLKKAREGHAEARTIVLGGLVFVGASLNDIAIDLLGYRSVRLLPWGFLALLLSMAVSLGNRLTAMLNRLEEEVAERTAELSEANLRLSEAALVDPLTGLYNRRGFTVEVEAEILRVFRTGRSFVVVLADIDHFKSINDRYGHVFGDHVLARVAARLRDCVRDVDRVARWGGEEFILLLPETDSEGAVVLAEKLRQAVAEADFQLGDHGLSVTMTFGVASFRKGESLDACIARADTALYKGKESGRNRVVIGRYTGLSLVH